MISLYSTSKKVNSKVEPINNLLILSFIGLISTGLIRSFWLSVSKVTFYLGQIYLE